MELGVTAVMLPELDFNEQVELCRSLGIKYYQYRPRIVPEDQRGKPYSCWGNHKFDLTPERLMREGRALTQKLRQSGMEPWGTLPTASIDHPDADLRLHIEGAARAEARCARIAPPSCPNKPFDYGALLDRIIKRYAQIIETISRPLGIKLVIETHCNSLATSPGLAYAICRHFNPRDLGVIFDIANFGREGYVQPQLAVSVLREYIDCIHLGGTRRVIADNDELGCKTINFESCALEESDLHMPTWIKTLHAAGIQAPIIIEDFSPHLTGADKLRRSAAFLRKATIGLD